MYHIHERSFLKIILCCSLLISANAFAEGPVGHFERVEVYDDGRYKGIRGINKSTPYQHGRVWQGVFDSHTGQYASFDGQDLRVRHARTGLTSSSKISATVESRVARSTVLKNLLSKARVGGKFLKVGGGPIGFAVTTAAFHLVDAALSEEGYEYNSDHENFGKTEPDFGYCVSELNTGSACSEERIKLKQDYWQEGAADNEALKQAMCKLAYSKGYFFNPVKFTPTNFSTSGGWCSAQIVNAKGEITHDVLMTTLRYVKYKGKFTPISQSDFDRIVGPKADSAPSQYVNATANEDGSIPGESQRTPTVPNGTVITLGPATGQDGRPFQITISFTTGADGNTTAKVTTTPRPDLTPGSPAAPKTNPTPAPGENGKPGGQPNPNPDGSPGSQPDPTPDGSPSDKTKPDPDGSPGGKDKPDPNSTPDGKDDPKPDDKPKEGGGLLCDVFPNILACDKMGKPEEGMFDSIKIPHVTDDNTWNTDNFLPPNGVCPQPKSFNIWGRPVQISYEPLCVFMQNIRFAVLLGFIIMSAFIVFGSLRKG